MKRLVVVSSAAIAAAGLSAPSMAQTAQDDAAAGAYEQAIIVTARRTSESIQDVPVAITAYNSALLEQKGVRSVYDLQQATPGLVVTNTQSQGRASGGYNIRGQNQSADDAPPGVVAYLNDVPVYGGAISRGFFDIETVQVLKGPQGTLFGKNTNGGAILVNSKRPNTDQVEGYVTARYGNYDDKYLEAAVNVPLGSAFAARVAGNLERRHGFTKNLTGPDLDNLHYGNLRASLLVKPEGSTFENLTIFNYTNIDESGAGYKLNQLITNPAITGGQPFSAIRAAELNAGLARDERTVSNENSGFTYVKALGVTNTTNVDLTDNILLKNIAGYQELKFEGLGDTDNVKSDFLSVEYARYNKQFTEELQLQGKFLENRLNLIVGGFYLQEKQDPFNGRTRFGATSAGYVLTPELFYNLQFTHTDLESKALFTQATFKMTETLSLTAGYRYTWDELKLRDQHKRVFVPGTILLPPAVPLPLTSCGFAAPPGTPDPRLAVDYVNCVRTGKANFSAGNYNVSIDWKPNSDILVYLAQRHGYKSGGINVTSSFYGKGSIYNPEKVDDVELGVKLSGDVGGMRYHFNASAFHSWYDGLQLVQVISDASGPQSLTQNTGRARLWGGDLDVSLEPVRGLTLAGTFSYFDGKFTRQNGIIIGAQGVPVNLVGLKYRSQPKALFTLSAAYKMPINQDSDIDASVFFSHTQGYYASYDVLPGNFIPSYNLINARLGVTNIGGTGLGLAIFGKNLTDEVYTNGITRSETFGYISRIYGEPRTYGVEATFKF